MQALGVSIAERPPRSWLLVALTLVLSLAINVPARAGIPQEDLTPAPVTDVRKVSEQSDMSEDLRNVWKAAGPGFAALRRAAPSRLGPLAGDRSAPWAWPISGADVLVKPFDAPAQRWLPGHRGVDVAGFEGSPVLAVADGIVSYSGVINSVGILSVQHSNGLLSTYQPVSDRPPAGTAVSQGEHVGTLASQGSHCWPLNCLHLGARRGTTYLDPMLLLQAWEVSLLPTGVL